MMDIFLHHPLHTANGKGHLEVALQVGEGELLAITGPSGSGKTTLLRILAGLLHPREGKIIHREQVWLDTQRGIRRRPQEREAGMVFQDYALFPNMNVRENLAFALPKGGDSSIIEALSDICALGELLWCFPNQLSGGQQQRVALARALVRRPSLLLLDEPLSALDLSLRSRLQDYVLEVHRQFGLTTLLVSHDYAEIRKMADRMIRMDMGKVVESGTPVELLGPEPQWQKVVFLGWEREGEARLSLQGHIFSMPISLEESRFWQEGQEVQIGIKG